jgi:hypothetical protein
MCYGIGEFLDSMLGLELSLAKRGTGSITKSFRDEQPPYVPKVFFGFSVFAGAIRRGFEDKIARSQMVSA